MPVTAEEGVGFDKLLGLLTAKPDDAPPQKDASDGSDNQQEPEGRHEDDVSSGEAADAGDDVWNSDDTLEQSADEGASDDGEKDETEEDHAGRDHEPFYTVTVDGKSDRVPLSELVAGYQRNRDYTQKTTAVAEQRKAIETELTSVRAAREQLDGLLKVLQDQMGDEGGEPKPTDWEKLKAEDPEAYAVQYADYARRRDARAAVKAERERIANERQAEQLTKLREYVQGEDVKLLEKFPSWKDPAKRETGAKAIFSFAAKRYGFTDAELNQTYDHRIVVMAEDARKYHELIAKREVGKTKLDKAPVVPPRGRAPQPSRRQAETDAARKRFAQTGKVDDALPLILTR